MHYVGLFIIYFRSNNTIKLNPKISGEYFSSLRVFTIPPKEVKSFEVSFEPLRSGMDKYTVSWFYIVI